jgi:hypothetical protein
MESDLVYSILLEPLGVLFRSCRGIVPSSQCSRPYSIKISLGLVSLSNSLLAGEFGDLLCFEWRSQRRDWQRADFGF